jgi:hypothetical protein
MTLLASSAPLALTTRWNMILKTKSGHKINVDDYIEQMKSNVRNKLKITTLTPIGKTADNGYFWWDEVTNPWLDKKSVNDLIKAINKMVVTEEKGKLGP